MENKQVIEGLKRFCRRDSSALKKVAVRGQEAYVSDGAIGIAVKLPDQQVDDVPVDYPLDNLAEIIREAKPCTAFKFLNIAKFGEVDEEFSRRLEELRTDARRQFEENFKRCVCPHCGDEVYFDEDTEDLFDKEEVQARLEIGEMDINLYVTICFSDDKRFGEIRVNLRYLHVLCDIYGRHGVRFAIGVNYSGKSMLCFESEDGSMKGVIMPVRACIADMLDGFEINTED